MISFLGFMEAYEHLPKHLRDIVIHQGSAAAYLKKNGSTRKDSEKKLKQYKKKQYSRDFDTPEERDHEGNDISDRDHWSLFRR